MVATLFKFAALLSVLAASALGAALPAADGEGHHQQDCSYACAERDLRGHRLQHELGHPNLGTLTCEYHDGMLDMPWARPVCKYDFHGVLTEDKDDKACPPALSTCGEHHHDSD